jgi:hypothetical protein
MMARLETANWSGVQRWRAYQKLIVNSQYDPRQPMDTSE